jgi:hypothetical protein
MVWKYQRYEGFGFGLVFFFKVELITTHCFCLKIAENVGFVAKLFFA